MGRDVGPGVARAHDPAVRDPGRPAGRGTGQRQPRPGTRRITSGRDLRALHPRARRRPDDRW